MGRAEDIKDLSERILTSLAETGQENGMARALLSLIGPTDEELESAVGQIYSERPELKAIFEKEVA